MEQQESSLDVAVGRTSMSEAAKHGLGRVRCPRESSGLVEVTGLIRIPASLHLRCMGATANRVFTRDEKDHEGDHISVLRTFA